MRADPATRTMIPRAVANNAPVFVVEWVTTVSLCEEPEAA
jgi:hypothetical protein